MDWQRMASQAIEQVHASLPEDATIANAARRRNGLGVTETRAIVVRVCGLHEMGVGR